MNGYLTWRRIKRYEDITEKESQPEQCVCCIRNSIPLYTRIRASISIDYFQILWKLFEFPIPTEKVHRKHQCFKSLMGNDGGDFQEKLFYSCSRLQNFGRKNRHYSSENHLISQTKFMRFKQKESMFCYVDRHV